MSTTEMVVITSMLASNHTASGIRVSRTGRWIGEKQRRDVGQCRPNITLPRFSTLQLNTVFN